MVLIICKVCNEKTKVENKRYKMCSKCCRNKQLERCKLYKKNNSEKIKEYNHDYKEKNKEMISSYNKKYNIENREQIQKKYNQRMAIRRKIDPKLKKINYLRKRFKEFVKSNSERSFNRKNNLVGCSRYQFQKWIEYNFDDKMNWENYNKVWHYDHVLLVSLFDFDKDEDIKICFNWQNTRPLLVEQNLSRKTLKTKDLLNHEIKLHHYKKTHTLNNELKINFAYLTTKS